MAHLAFDVLYQFASHYASPRYTLDIARMALTHRHQHSDHVVCVAKNIVAHFANDARASVVQPHPTLPPGIDLDRVQSVIEDSVAWKAPLPQDVLELALHDVILYGCDVELLKDVIAAGADVNAIHEVLYFPPLTVAARKGTVEHVRILLDAGADVHCRVGGHSALMHATWCGHDEVVQELLSRGAMRDS
jgi:hypothetical protein